MTRRIGWLLVLGSGALVAILTGLVLGGAVLLVAVAIGALAWVAVSSYHGGAAVRPIGPEDTAEFLVPGNPAGLTNRQLCVAWQMTHTMLARAAQGVQRDELVALRTRYLDELERRDPSGFRRWLESGTQFGDDPGRFIEGAGGPGLSGFPDRSA